MKSSIQLSPNNHLENMGKMFRKLYQDEQLTDVTLCCKDGTIKAHKLILATCSPYFHKIFTENQRTNTIDHHPIIIMYGVQYQHLHDLIELIYKGNVEVLPESLNYLYELAGEFQLTGISGVLRNEVDDNTNGLNSTFPVESKCNENSHGRDTRFKGLKRVAVDYTEFENDKTVPQINGENNKSTSSEESTPASKSIKEEANSSISNSVQSSDGPKLSAWAKKQRKFKCDLCPSSFKRSSHLTRHQLVHTGERPYACSQCDKAFSRHDKLKHHVRKAHEHDYETDYAMELASQSVVVRDRSPLPFFIASDVRTDHLISQTVDSVKRPRGRPRKYPIGDKPLTKRGRGRPPRINPLNHNDVNGENYDITNLPYGDLDYLTMPLQQNEDSSTVMIEPIVEIQTDSIENNKDETEDNDDKKVINAVPYGEIKKEISHREDNANSNPKTNLKVLENKIAEIGECTISSVANH